MCVESQDDGPAIVLEFLRCPRREDAQMTEKAEQVELYRAYLNIAVFCERVLREADNVMSLIRVIDRFYVRGASVEMGNHVLRFVIVLLFKAGFLRGKQIIRVRPLSPSKKQLPAMEIPTLFEGDEDRGNATVAETQFVVNEEGLYWFDVFLNDELVTRMPLRVIYQQVGTPVSGA
jgi:hypothetical protein